MANLTKFYIVNIPYSEQNLCYRGSSLYRKSTVTASVVPQGETSKLPGRKVSEFPKNQGTLGQGEKNAHREF